MPAEPPDGLFTDKVRAKAYPCQERNGVIWAYLGPREEPPHLPDLEANMLPDGQGSMWTALRDCNWLQALEGDIDTGHFALLHLGSVFPGDLETGSFDYYSVKDRAPLYEVVDTEYGTMYGARRPAEEDTYYWRIAKFLFPFYTLIPTGEFGAQKTVRAWVPLDDEHTMFWNLTEVPRNERSNSGQYGGPVVGRTDRTEFLPNTTDWLGCWRLKSNASNDYRIDREVQRSQSYTGIPGIQEQDQGTTESMGGIVDRSIEHLGSSDAMIIRTRRQLMRAAIDLREGTIPTTVDQPKLYRQRSGGVILSRTANWVDTAEGLRA